jgi:hypothetical protein
MSFTTALNPSLLACVSRRAAALEQVIGAMEAPPGKPPR